jgi:hypothetical protein
MGVLAMNANPKFEFYFPKVTALDILKAIFSELDVSKQYSCNPVKYNKFFQGAAKKYPSLFEDIYIDDDAFLPYSPDIEQAYSSAVEFDIIRRPNPDIYPCVIVASKERLLSDIESMFTALQLDELREIAKDFERELQEQPG